jgi:hypothetical protein
VRVIGEVEARFGAGGIAAGIDAEGADLPIRGNGADQEEDEDQSGGEQQESKPAPPATVRLVTRATRAADWRCGDDGLSSRRRGNGGGSLRGWLRLRMFGLRRARLGRGATDQPGKPLVQLCLIGLRSQILWLFGPPREEAHLQPTLAPPDYDPCFARGRSAMPL